MTFDECVREFKVFAQGGHYSRELLSKVWPNILREYNVDPGRYPLVLKKAGMFISQSGRIRRFLR